MKEKKQEKMRTRPCFCPAPAGKGFACANLDKEVKRLNCDECVEERYAQLHYESCYHQRS